MYLYIQVLFKSVNCDQIYLLLSIKMTVLYFFCQTSIDPKCMFRKKSTTCKAGPKWDKIISTLEVGSQYST